MPALLAGPALLPPPVSTLAEAIVLLGRVREPWLTVHHGVHADVHSGAQVLALARGYAAAAARAGVRPGDRVLVLLPNDVRFVGAFFGVVLSGAVPVPLPWPATFAPTPRTLEPLHAIARVAAAAAVVTDRALGDPGFGVPVIDGPATGVAPEPSIDPASPAFVQFTSGSLGRPRGAVIAHRAAIACACSMGQVMELSPRDVGVSWLPLFHDMGLVGALLCPLLYGFPLHLMAPGEFLLHPRRWLERLSRFHGTVAAAPDFAYDLVARRVRDTDGLDLSRWRWALDGSEPVLRRTIDGVTAKLAPAGFRRDALRPVYGLAENTLGVSFSDGTAPDRVESRPVPSVGPPLPGVAIDVADGEILVRSRSLMSGYLHDDEATAACMADGWLRTGDLGAIDGGRLYVTGRSKDLVIQNGRKFHPYDIERVAAIAACAPPNGAAAFAVAGLLGADELVVVVEAPGRMDDVERRVRASLADELGARPDRVVRVNPGDIPRTTSGKVRRPECMARWGSA